MITVTPEAAAQIVKAAEQAGAGGACLRLAARLEEPAIPGASTSLLPASRTDSSLAEGKRIVAQVFGGISTVSRIPSPSTLQPELMWPYSESRLAWA